ncbi:MAG: biliverdin-producing heme oxygenase, partial [Blastocatellia bacterium]
MIMIRLRQKTLRLHLRLKQELDLWRRFATPDDYRRMLERFLGFYGPVETALERHFSRRADGFNFERRRKVPMLVSDLRSLGVEQFTTLPRCALLPTISSTPQAFGCLYAIEISTLGGQTIARHLNRAFGVSPGSG